jgi:hypothetical protein
MPRIRVAAKAERMTENDLHRQVTDYLAAALIPPETWFTTFPVGGGGRGAQLKGRHLKAGVPDILIIHASFVYWVELKTMGGRLTTIQQMMHCDLRAAGCDVEVARSLDDVAALLARWEIPIRGKLS